VVLELQIKDMLEDPELLLPLMVAVEAGVLVQQALTVVLVLEQRVVSE